MIRPYMDHIALWVRIIIKILLFLVSFINNYYQLQYIVNKPLGWAL